MTPAQMIEDCEDLQLAMLFSRLPPAGLIGSELGADQMEQIWG